ncbi:MAG: Rne/Rng family ribonuclease, partial [Dongiaceae bacterium]
AFVDYGGNRHGFLAFNEIHPDYYRIPMADREALQAELEAQAAANRDDGEFDPIEPAQGRRRHGDRRRGRDHRAPQAERGARGAGDEAPAGQDIEAPDHDDHAHDDHDRGHDHGHDHDHDHGHHENGHDPHDRHGEEDASDPYHADAPEAGSLGRDDPPEDAADFLADAPRDDEAAGGETDGDETRGGEAPGDEARDDDAGEDAPRAQPLSRAGAWDDRLEAPLPEGEAENAEERGAAEGMASKHSGAGSEDGADELPGTPVAGDIEQHAATPPEAVEVLGGSEDEDEAEEPRRPRSVRRYKIQEVVKRRQIMLVQVTKEERGNKGAALTTYLSLAGRYCVLMPNTARGGGISRKITSMIDRKRLKSLVGDLDIPRGMAVIVRTAGSERSKAEIKRDYEYLLRLWNEIRDLTLRSTAPALIYEEANLIKRSIRDLYTKDIDDIIVEGDEGYKTAKAFMKTLTPSHAKRVQAYRDPMIPLLQRYQVEAQLDAMHNPVVQLKSGGYIVINQTEALVSIDVNSGRATRERNIEDTALKTNLEASDEIARQLRLRDMAGLVVIDFIDMEENRHNAQVERRLKEAMRFDRARIQLGRISPFGLLELSRQRLRPSLVEASTEVCRFCRGTGRTRSTESTALHVLRAIEEEGSRRRGPGITVAVPTTVALYILNQKRRRLSEIESRFGFRVYLSGDDALIAPDFRLDRLRALAPGEELPPPPETLRSAPIVEEPEEETVEAGIEGAEESPSEIETDGEAREEDAAERDAEPVETREGRSEGDRGERGGRRRRRRRRRGGGHDGEGRGDRQGARPDGPPAQRRQEPAGDEGDAGDETTMQPADGDAAERRAEPGEPHPASQGGEQPRRRRRGRRGGRRRSRRGQNGGEDQGQLRPEHAAEARPDELPGEQRPSEAGNRRYTGPTPANPWGSGSDPLSSPWGRTDDEDAPQADAPQPDDDIGNRRGKNDPGPEAWTPAQWQEETAATENVPPPPHPQPAPEAVHVEETRTAEPPADAEPAPRRRGWWRRRE